MNVSFIKIFDKYELAVIEHDERSYEVRILLRNLPTSFPICSADQCNIAHEKANRFLDVYETAKKYNFQMHDQGMVHESGYVVRYDDLFIMPPEQFKALFEQQFEQLMD